MKDLLSNYVVISSDCTSQWVVRLFYPQLNKNFIKWNTPLTAHLFEDDFDFLKFCENYDELVDTCPEIKDGSYLVKGLKNPIKMIHDSDSPDALLEEKWIGRASRGIKKQKIFCWSSGAFRKEYSEKQRKKLLDRFRALNGYTIFLTERSEEAFISKNHWTVFLEVWKGKKQDMRAEPYNHLTWNLTGEPLKNEEGNLIEDFYGGPTVIPFKRIIESKILR